MDLFGSTVLEYLTKNPLEKGSHATRWLVHFLVGQRLPFLGLGRWKLELLVEEENVAHALDLGISSNEVQSLLKKLLQLEFQEVLSLLELKLWRIKLDEYPMDENGEMVHESVSRQICRVGCGISIVIEHMLPFLSKQVVTT